MPAEMHFMKYGSSRISTSSNGLISGLASSFLKAIGFVHYIHFGNQKIKCINSINNTLKISLVNLFAFAYIAGFCQSNPTIFGKVNELSVNPDLSIWLTTETGNIYKTSNIDSTWEIILETNPGITYEIAAPHMDRILFFNRDTAIVFGYLTKNFYEERKNKVFRTTNRGKTWEWIEFGHGDQWIRDGQAFENGTCWLASNKGYFYFSMDYGKSWKKNSKIFSRVQEAYMRGPDISSFHCTNDKFVLVANKNNQLAISANSILDFKMIPTPLDQGLFEKEYRSYYLNGTGRLYVENLLIQKVRVFANHYFVFQNNELYYTSKDKVEWHRYPLEIIGFEVDDSSNKMYGVTKAGKVIEIQENLSPIEIMEYSIYGQYIDIKIENNNVVLLTGWYSNDTGEDKVRDQHGNLTVIQNKYREREGYYIYQINRHRIKSIQLRAQ